MSTLERFRQVAAVRKPVPIDINGEQFFVRGLSGAERHVLFLNKQKAEAAGSAMSDVDWIAAGMCDSEGRPLFDGTVDAAAVLSPLDGAILNKVALAIARESGLAEDATAKNS